MKPTIGRIVIVRDTHNKYEFAGIVSKVNDDGSINVHAFCPGGVSVWSNCYEVGTMRADGSDHSMTWEWPQRA